MDFDLDIDGAWLDELFTFDNEQSVDKLFQILSEESVLVPDVTTRDFGTQTELDSPELCVVAHCYSKKRIGRRCLVHLNQKDVSIKENVSRCFKCNNETFTSAYKACRDHELQMGNLEGEVGIDFYSREIDFKRCVSRRCYREATIGWRCKHHDKNGVKLYKFTKRNCKYCEREVYGKNYDVCKLHK